MTQKMGYRWLLREVMAEHGMWKTTDLVPLLAEQGIHLSAAQTYRLVTQVPERLSLPVLAALYEIFDCSWAPARARSRRGHRAQRPSDSASRPAMARYSSSRV